MICVEREVDYYMIKPFRLLYILMGEATKPHLLSANSLSHQT